MKKGRIATVLIALGLLWRRCREQRPKSRTTSEGERQMSSMDAEVDAGVTSPLIEFDAGIDLSVVIGDDDYINLVEVVWSSEAKHWQIEGHYAISKRETRASQTFSLKPDAVREAIRYCKAMASPERRLELQIKNKNGQIGKGGSAKRSYGRDPRGEG